MPIVHLLKKEEATLLRFINYISPVCATFFKKPNIWLALIMVLAHLFVNNAVGHALVLTTFLIAMINIFTYVPTLEEDVRANTSLKLDHFLNTLAGQLVVLCALFLVVWHDGAVLIPAIFIAMTEVAHLQLALYTAVYKKACFVPTVRFINALAIAVFLTTPLLSLEHALWLLDGPATRVFWVIAIANLIAFFAQTRFAFTKE